MDPRCGPDEVWSEDGGYCIPAGPGEGPGNTTCPAGTVQTADGCVPAEPSGPGGCPPGTSEGADGACHYPNEDRTPRDRGDGGGGGYGGDFPVFTGGSGGPRFNIPGVPPFKAPKFTAPDPFAPPAPFKPPTAFQAPKFTLPGQDEVLKDPGYQFRADQGRKGLEASAAARGTLNTGGTLKGIIDYGQALASQEYGNVVNRAFGAYDRNYQGAVDEYDRLYRSGLDTYNLGYRSEFDKYNLGYKSKLDEFDREYAGAKDMYAPLLAQWQVQSTAAMRAAELAWQREWDRYLAELERWKHLTPSAGDILRAGAD